MSEEDLVNRVTLVAASKCNTAEAIEVRELLKTTFSSELMEKFTIGVVGGPSFYDIVGAKKALSAFIAGAYAAIVLKDCKASVEELEKLWRKT